MSARGNEGETNVFYFNPEKEGSPKKFAEVNEKERLAEDEEGARERWGNEW